MANAAKGALVWPRGLPINRSLRARPEQNGMPAPRISGVAAPRTRLVRLAPRRVPGVSPPSPAVDPELYRVRDAVLAADPVGDRFAETLRHTIDQLLDGQHTGRWD